VTKWQALKKKQTKVGIDALEQRVLQAERVAPVYSHLFDSYRIKCMKKIMQQLVLTELRYHCQVIEELSPILEMLHNIPDELM
jgi:hypothetical protein